MKKIVLTSKNPVKKETLEKAISTLFPNEIFEIIQLPLEKDGPEPIGKEVILNQIRNVINEARTKISDADYYIAMEGGMVIENGIMHETAYVIVQNSKRLSFESGCTTFSVPPLIARDVKNGIDFADSVDKFFNTSGTKQGIGFVGTLTGGVITKKDHYYQPLIIAFSCHIHKGWYDDSNYKAIV